MQTKLNHFAKAFTIVLLGVCFAWTAGLFAQTTAGDAGQKNSVNPVTQPNVTDPPFPPPMPPEIDVRYDGTSIPSGTGEFDFGGVATGGDSSVSFSIENWGGPMSVLTLSGSPYVSITGTNPGDFAVTTQPATSNIPMMMPASFTIKFTPGASGARQATVSIPNNDSNENPYTFTVKGTGSGILNQDGLGFSGLIESNPLSGSVEMTGYNTWPAGFTKGTSAFLGGVFDGKNIWMIPHGADRVVKVDVATGTMTGYNTWPAGFTKSDYAFTGGVFDGKNIWMIPFSADRVVKVDVATGTMTGYDTWPAGFAKSNYAFSGGVFDGANIWMIPYHADRVVKVDVATGTMTGYDTWPAGFTKDSFAFSGGVFDGANIWMIPNKSDRVVKVDVATGTMTGYDTWPAGFTKDSFAFSGGVFDGANIWMIPNNADRVVKVDVATGTMTGYNTWPAAFTKGNAAFRSGVFDGANIWMIPYSADRVIKIGASLAPEIDVQGNYVSIANGDTLPALTDWTDFDSISVAIDSLEQTFTILNTGTTTLYLGSSTLQMAATPPPTDAVTITGDHAVDFVVTEQPAVSVEPGDSTTFKVKFSPSVIGLRIATVNIASDDADENPYTFAIQGTGTMLSPEIDVRGNGVSIANGDTLPSFTDFTDFDSVGIAGDTLVQTFTIHNTGAGTLHFLPPDFAKTAGAQSVLGIPSAIMLSGDHAADFEVTQQPAPSVAPGDSTTFKIKFDPSVDELRSATVLVSNNDPDENPYTFAIQGTGVAPEIDVRGNAISITTGDTLPSFTDFTDFDSVGVAGDTLVQTFTIHNSGTDTLHFNPPSNAQNNSSQSIMWLRGGAVTLSGTHAADFEVTQQPAPSVLPGDSTTFKIKFDPSDTGLRTATVSISNNDPDENPYTFAIQGTGTMLSPEIDVRGNGISIANGDTLPALMDWTDFDSISVAIDSLEQTFTIHNTGSATLHFLPPDFAQTIGSQSVLSIPSAVTLSGDHAADFEVTQQPAATVAPGDSTTFKIKFDPSDTGLRTATVSVSNNDPDENPYTFAIQGTGTAPEIDVQGNGLSIANGDTLPSVADFTSFGATAVKDSTIQQSFKIFNTGNEIMYLGNRNQRRTQLASPGKSDIVKISGDHAADFSVTTDADPVIDPGDSSVFTIEFDPSAGGVRSALVGIESNDADENSFSFKIQGTGIEPPTVTTATIDSITVISAVIGGNVTNNGGDSVTVRGVCWGLTANPTIDSSYTTDGSGNGTFLSLITNLAHGTTYHVRAYATNSAGTGYGADSTFTTKQIIITTVPVDTLLRGGRQVTYAVHIANVLPAMRGFSAQVDFDPNHFTSPQFNQGAYLKDLTHWDTDGSNGSYSVSCATLGTTNGATGDGVLFTVQLTTADSVTNDLVDPDSANLVVSEVTLRDLDNKEIICDSIANAHIVIDTAPPTLEAKTDADSTWYRSQPYAGLNFEDNYNLDTLAYKINDGDWTTMADTITTKTYRIKKAPLPGYAELAERKALHWIYMRARDDAGNLGGYDQSWNFCFYKDETAPDGELALSFANVAATSMDVVGAAFGDSTQGQVYYEFVCTTNATFNRARSLADSIHECTGLTPNTQYSFKYQVSDGVNDPNATPAYNATEWSADSTKYTLSVAPTTTTVTCDKSGVIKTTTLTFTAVGGFGAGKIQYYRYILNDSVSHVWTGAETQWNSGTLQMGIPKANTNYYLHVKGYNAEDVANGTLALGPYQWDGTPISPVTKLEMTAVVNSLELSWTNPKDDAHKIQVWLKGFGGYPKYTGSVPQFPENPTAASNNGWFMATNSLASSFKYSPNSRDYYYVAIFVEDLAQHYSAAALDSSLSYWLGDVNPTPDGAVNASDIAILASAFYTHPADNGWNGICDVGPTLDYARISRPVPDSSINFEDLMIFAMNYENTGPVQLKKPAVLAENNPVMLELNLSPNNGRFLGRILLAENASLVKALEIPLVLGAEVQVLSVRKGSLVSDGDFFLSNQDGGTLSIATAALDESGVFDGNGVLAEFDFQVSGANLELHFGTATARTAKNVAIEINYQTTDVELLAQSLIPTEYKLHQNFPNPFNPQTTIRYDLKENGPVQITLYNINGQFVATLLSEEKQAGYHSYVFEAGYLPSGVYIYKIQMNDFRDIRKLVLIK